MAAKEREDCGETEQNILVSDQGRHVSQATTTAGGQRRHDDQQEHQHRHGNNPRHAKCPTPYQQLAQKDAGRHACDHPERHARENDGTRLGLVPRLEPGASFVREGKVAFVMLARRLLDNPHWPNTAARELGLKTQVLPTPYAYWLQGWSRIAIRQHPV